MADAYILRGGNLEFKTFGTIKIKANSGATVTCNKQDSDTSYTNIVPEGSNFIEFKAELGNWTIVSNYKGTIKNSDLVVDDLGKIYEIDHYIPFGGIKVIANAGTSISCVKGEKNYNKNVNSGSTFVIFEELELGEWTITSTRNGKNKNNTVNVEEDGIVYEVNHQINTASIKVIANNGTTVSIECGDENYSQSVSNNSVTFSNISFGTWSVVSTRAGKTMNVTVELNELDKTYEITHQINTANIRVNALNGTNVVCSMGNESYNKNVGAEGFVDFNNLSFGDWTISSTLNGRNMKGNVNLSVLDQLYTVNHQINTGYIRVLGNEGTTVVCSMGGETYTKTIDSSGYVDFLNLLFGTWTIKSTYNGKILQNNIVVNILNGKHEIDHRMTIIYGIAINQDNTDPTTAVSYTNDAVGFTPLSCNASTGVCNYGSWKDIITNVFGCRPCLVKDGVRTVYLNPDNYAQDINGSPVDITSGNAGDVMIEFKKCWYRYREDGNTLYFEISNTQQSGFVTTAFTSEDGNGRDVDYFYYSAYEGYVDENNKLRSLSGKTPTNDTHSNYNSYASNNGSGYTIECFAKRIYILGLLMLVTKSRDGQAKIGSGKSSHNGNLNTGTMNTKGLFYGKNDISDGIKCFGIEHMWGNYAKTINGLVSGGYHTSLYVKLYSPYATGLNISEVYQNSIKYKYSYIVTDIYCKFLYIILKQKVYENGSIILPSLIQEDETKGWCDSFNLPDNPGGVYVTGGSSAFKNNTGPFVTILSNNLSSSSSDICSRIILSK